MQMQAQITSNRHPVENEVRLQDQPTNSHRRLLMIVHHHSQKRGTRGNITGLDWEMTTGRKGDGHALKGNYVVYY